MTSLYETMQKLAVVDKRVKQYRRSLQMLESGSHDWHGTSNLQGVANLGALAPGPRAAMGSGVYFFEGKPNHGYWDEGGVAVPHAALGGAQRLPFNNDLGEANLLSSGRVPLKPVDKKVPATPLSPAQKLIQKRIDPTRFAKPEAGTSRQHTYMFAEHGNQGALRELQQKNHVRTVDTDVLNLARRSVSDWAKHHTDAPDGSGRGRLLQVLDGVSDEARNRLSVPAATGATLSGSTIRPAQTLSAPKVQKWWLPYAHRLAMYGPMAGAMAYGLYSDHKRRQLHAKAMQDYMLPAATEDGEQKTAFDAIQAGIRIGGPLLGGLVGRKLQSRISNPYVASSAPAMGAMGGLFVSDTAANLRSLMTHGADADQHFMQHIERLRRGEPVPELKDHDKALYTLLGVDHNRPLHRRVSDLMQGRKSEPIFYTPVQTFQKWRTGSPVLTSASDEEQRLIEHLKADPSKPFKRTFSDAMTDGMLAPVVNWHKYVPKPEVGAP